MLELWGEPRAANVQKPIWYLREIDVPVALRGLSFDGDLARDTVYLKIRGAEASPVLRDGNYILWEGNSIVRYLADCYGNGRFYANEPARRADIDRWMDYQLSTIRPPLHGLLRSDLDTNGVARAARQLAEAMAPLEATLANQPYLTGDDFTIADIPTGINAFRWQILDIERPSSPAIEAWVARLRARPAFAATILPPTDTSVAVRALAGA